MGGFVHWFKKAKKREKFAAILGALAVLGTVFSLLAKVTIVPKDDATSYRIAVVAPLSGPSAEIGMSLKQGASFFADGVNKAGGIDGSTVVVETFDEATGDSVVVAERIVKEGRFHAVIGHWTPESQAVAAPIYKQAGLPFITLSAGWMETASEGGALASVFDAKSEGRFLSNYARNVIGFKLMSIIEEESDYGKAMADAFTDNFARFGAPPQFRWSFKPGDEASIKELVETYRAKRDEAGALFLAASETSAPAVVAAIKNAGLRAVWFGPSVLATNAFTKGFDKLVAPGEVAQNYTNGFFAAAPLLFDTANETAQDFKVAYKSRFATEPDWVAAFGHDGVKVIVDQVRAQKLAGGSSDIAAKRSRLQTGLAALSGLSSTARGITGTIAFAAGKEGAPTPVLMGVYNGAMPISALTQLQPIPKGAVANYIEELRQGRVLYVNDRFMYKTNVVYVGVQVHEISEFDLEKETAQVEISVWFRYRGSFEPQNVLFTNAAKPLALDAPVFETAEGDMVYRLYRVKGTFNLNFSGAPRVYGSHIAGVAFRHKTLNRNNLRYVVDVLGMPYGDALKERLIKDKVIAPGLGWVTERASVSQEEAREDALGEPKYVGYGSIASDFSKITLAIVIKKDGVSAGDVIPNEWFIYIAIFGFLASLFAAAMDAKKLGKYWAVQSFGLRIAFWPLLLLAAGNLILDYAYQNLSLSQVYLAVMIYDSLWWIMPALLLDMAIRRFAWAPIEDRTGHKIPNVVRLFASFFIFALAFVGVVGFVLVQPVTSLLAGSGLLAMIVGLAIQANISNVFSGIVLNMERPFKVGDWVKIGNAEDARVTDITWRTTRLMTRSGMSIAIPNGKASEAQIVNYSVQGKSQMCIHLFVAPSISSETVRKTLRDAPLAVPGVMSEPPPGVYFDGIVAASGGWLAQYSVLYWIKDYSGKTAVNGRVWDTIYSRLNDAGIPLGVPPDNMRGGSISGVDEEDEVEKFKENPEHDYVVEELVDQVI